MPFAADGARLAVGFRGDLKVFDLPGRRVLCTIPQGVLASHGATLALSPDGAVLASAGADKAVKLWDVKEAKELKNLGAHKETAYYVAFNSFRSLDHFVDVFGHDLEMDNATTFLCRNVGQLRSVPVKLCSERL